MADQQEAFDEAFNIITSCEESLNQVIVNLEALGVKIEPWQRLIVSRWLDMFPIDTPVPLRNRVSLLQGWLEESCRAR